MFLDDQADDDCNNEDDDGESTGDTDEMNSFIDEEELNETFRNLASDKIMQIETNKIALLNYLQSVSKTDLESLGLNFTITSINDLFE